MNPPTARTSRASPAASAAASPPCAPVAWRRLAVARQGLASAAAFGRGLPGAARAIEHLGYVQIDTLAVVERAHHHVLWARVPGYRPAHLDALVRDRSVFEYWFHAASYLPMRDYRFAQRRMAGVRARPLTDGEARLMQEILARVRGDGDLRVRDLEADRTGPGVWWNWGPGRRAVERLFMQGDLMVRERRGMEKVFDLTERVLPGTVDRREPTTEEHATYLLDTSLRAHGLVTWQQLVHLQTGMPLRAAMREVLQARIAGGQLVPVTHPRLPTAHVEASALERPIRAPVARMRLLSPFDNLVIHRDRMEALFGFTYRLECYVPAAQRVYGYFCLPILWGDRLVGRADCKAHRAEGRFEVRRLHLDDPALDGEMFRAAFEDAVRDFATFNGCSEVQV